MNQRNDGEKYILHELKNLKSCFSIKHIILKLTNEKGVKRIESLCIVY